MGFLFLLRTLIELRYPVSVPHSNHMVLAIVSLESSLFFITAMLAKRDKTDPGTTRTA